MILADFIKQNVEAILCDWEQFARTVPAAGHMDTTELRDEAREILLFIAEDMRSAQSDAQQEAKSKGQQPRTDGQDDTAAELHAVGRLIDGFTLPEMVSEYRALRVV